MSRRYLSASVAITGIAGLCALAVPVVFSRPLVAAAPKFEVASVKLCRAMDAPDGRAGGSGENASADRLLMRCQTVKRLIESAYASYEGGHFHPWPQIRTVGGPAWIDSDLYQIEAKADGPQSLGMRNGPMLQALLEDRFRLKVRREVRQVPVYELTALRGGPRFEPNRDGSCVSFDPDNLPPPRDPGRPPIVFCGVSRHTARGFEMNGSTMAELALAFSISGRLDRGVIDKTGIRGKFDIRLDMILARPSDAIDPADSLADVQSALGKAGLKLGSGKGPGEFLVIDSVARPSEN